MVPREKLALVPKYFGAEASFFCGKGGEMKYMVDKIAITELGDVKGFHVGRVEFRQGSYGSKEQRTVVVPSKFLEDSEYILTLASKEPPGAYEWTIAGSRSIGGNEPGWEPYWGLVQTREEEKSSKERE